MSEDAQPISYMALQPGTPVRTASGSEIGTLETVLSVPAEDLFDGIVVTTAAGSRFIDRDQIRDITTAYVTTLLSEDQARSLPEPSGTEVYRVDPGRHVGRTFGDWFGRMFRRGKWRRTV